MRKLLDAPYILGITGSVAVGKSTFANKIQQLLLQTHNNLSIELIATDNFLYPNTIVEKNNLKYKKGFPESYDQNKLINFLIDIKSSKTNLKIPVYSHQLYDIQADCYQEIAKTDILIVEGLNLLRSPDIFNLLNFTIYIDASMTSIENWYIIRFMELVKQAKNNPALYFHRFCHMNETEIKKYAKYIWESINKINLVENILPFKHLANLAIHKNSQHTIESIDFL